jgi:site-specific DNA-methyltransferase (adenine-specific)
MQEGGRVNPYYEDDAVALYHGDCRDVLPQLTDAIDTVITDPPYGVGMASYADDFAVTLEVLPTLPGALMACFTSPRRVPAVAAVPSWRFERLLWMHKSADMAAPWRGWCMNSEAVVVMSRPTAKWPPPGSYRSDTYSVGPWERAGHPAGKPLAVVADLVRRLSLACVLDPFAGSGTTLRAAKNEGRRAVGIELEERYCEIAARRLDQGVLDFGEVSA